MWNSMPKNDFDRLSDLKKDHEQLDLRILQEQTRGRFLAESRAKSEAKVKVLQREKLMAGDLLDAAKSKRTILLEYQIQINDTQRISEKEVSQLEAEYAEIVSVCDTKKSGWTEKMNNYQKMYDESVRNVWSRYPGFNDYYRDVERLEDLRHQLSAAQVAHVRSSEGRSVAHSKSESLRKKQANLEMLQGQLGELKERKNALTKTEDELKKKKSLREEEAARRQQQQRQQENQLQQQREKEAAVRRQQEMQFKEQQLQQQREQEAEAVRRQQEQLLKEQQLQLQREQEGEEAALRQEQIQREEEAKAARVEEERNYGEKSFAEEEQEDSGINETNMNWTLPATSNEDEAAMVSAMTKTSVVEVPKQASNFKPLGLPKINRNNNNTLQLNNRSFVESTPLDFGLRLSRRPMTIVPPDVTPIPKTSFLSTTTEQLSLMTSAKSNAFCLPKTPEKTPTVEQKRTPRPNRAGFKAPQVPPLRFEKRTLFPPRNLITVMENKNKGATNVNNGSVSNPHNVVIGQKQTGQHFQQQPGDKVVTLSLSSDPFAFGAGRKEGDTRTVAANPPSDFNAQKMIGQAPRQPPRANVMRLGSIPEVFSVGNGQRHAIGTQASAANPAGDVNAWQEAGKSSQQPGRVKIATHGSRSSLLSFETGKRRATDVQTSAADLVGDVIDWHEAEESRLQPRAKVMKTGSSSEFFSFGTDLGNADCSESTSEANTDDVQNKSTRQQRFDATKPDSDPADFTFGDESEQETSFSYLGNHNFGSDVENETATEGGEVNQTGHDDDDEDDDDDGFSFNFSDSGSKKFESGFSGFSF